MAVSRFLFTIGRVAGLLGVGEDRLYDIATSLEPEDGCLAVLDTGDEAVVVFTERGIENLRELLEDLGK